MLVIREAKLQDVDQMVQVLRDSIRELCVRDHGGAEQPLNAWLANKTPQSVQAWLEDPKNLILVAEVDGQTAAVGGLRNRSHITLNYVAPTFRFKGVSKQMMMALERHASRAGARRISLASTETARNFYLSLGYSADGSPETKFGLPSYPMSKALE